MARTTKSVEGWHYGLQAYFKRLVASTEFGERLENAEIRIHPKNNELFGPSAPDKTKNEKKTDASHTK